jgi:hypothetical protein
VLAWLGAKVARHDPEIAQDPEKLIAAVKSESKPILIAIVGLCALYVLAMRLTAPKKP